MRNLRSVLLVSLTFALMHAQALPNVPSTLVIVDLGPAVAISWVPSAAVDAEQYDVYGLKGGQATYLGSTQAPFTSFLAPGGYDGYRVLTSSGQAIGMPCLETSTNPPEADINFYCGNFAHGLQYAAPLP